MMHATYKTIADAANAAPPLYVCGIKMHPTISPTGGYSTLYAHSGGYRLAAGPLEIRIKHAEWSKQLWAEVSVYGDTIVSRKHETASEAAAEASIILYEMLAKAEASLARVREWKP